MALLPPTETLQEGIKYLENWLKINGFDNIEVNLWQSGSADLIARSLTQSILVQVRAAVTPAEPVLLNATDIFALKDLAQRLDLTPYAAYVIIDEDKKLIGDISWDKLPDV